MIKAATSDRENGLYALDLAVGAGTCCAGAIIGVLQIALRSLLGAQGGRRCSADRLERTMWREHRMLGRRFLDDADRKALAAVAPGRQQRAFKRGVAPHGALVEFPGLVAGV